MNSEHELTINELRDEELVCVVGGGSDEADKLTTNESSLTTNELNQVVGGMGPVFLSLMTARQPQKYLEIKNQDIVISS